MGLAFVFIMVAIAYALAAAGLPVWAGFAIVAALLIVIGVILFGLGRRQARAIKGPERFSRELQRTKDALSGQPSTE